MRVQFDDLTFDSETRQLWSAGKEIRLSPKAFDLLRVLIDNRTRAVSKAELHDRLWPGTFVTDANLAVLVAELRNALHDRPRAPKFVRTVRRFGYAFCGQISGAADVPATRRTCWIVWSGREIALHDGDNMIGHDPGATVRLDLPSVSRRHARIIVSTIGAVVEDLGSKNGTHVNGQRVDQRVALKDSDQIQFGSVTMTFRVLDRLPSTVTRRV